MPIWSATLLAAVLTAPSVGQANQPPSDDEWRRMMEERMRTLEEENRALRERVGATDQVRDAVMEDATRRDAEMRSLIEHYRTSPLFDVNKYAQLGDFPGSIRIPGTNISFQLGGFTQLDMIFDTNDIGSEDSFIVSSIPTDDDSAGQTSFSARQTRFFIKTAMPTQSLGDLITYLEGDFFGPDGTDFRLRHAYGEVGNKGKLLAGQTWTTFMDASVYPAIFDYQGPNAMVLVRQPILRYTQDLDNGWSWAGALEDPNPDVTSPLAGDSSARWPDFATYLRHHGDYGHLQLAGILRELLFDPDVGSRTSDLGWGLNFSGTVFIGQEIYPGRRNNVVFQLTGGQGIANYINDTSGLGFDAAGADLDALEVFGGFAAYQHFWTKELATSLGYSYLTIDTEDDFPATTYESGHYAVVNLWWYASERVLLGPEVLYGVREDVDGDEGDDFRLSFSCQFRF